MRYRLLKVVCQAVLISEDEDGNLVEQLVQPVPVSASEWPNYPARLASDINALNEREQEPNVLPIN